MTQDQYGEAQDAGYGVRGDVIEDQNDEYPADQSKPKTTFQKVASALRGDRPDRDEPDEDQTAATEVAATPVGTAPVGTPPVGASDVGSAAPPPADSDTVASPGTAADSDVMPQGNPPWPASPDAAGTVSSPDSPDALDAQDGDGTVRPDGAAGVTTDPNGTFASTDPNGTAATTDPHGVGATAGAGDREGDYWDESGAQVVGAVEVVTVTTPDVPGASFDAADDGRLDAVDDARLDAVDDGNVGGGSAYAGDSPQAGAATIPDVPVVTPAPEDSAATEAPNGVGRHAGPPAQELRPGEAPNTLDDLGDLAYGKLLPDAVDFTAQWQQIQFRFVDDPQASVTEAAEVVEQVTAKLEAAIAERKRAIEERQRAITERQRSLRGRWGEGAEADTETLRETLRMYRAFLDQLIGPKA